MDAMQLIHEQPIKVVSGHTAVTGGGPTGHPVEFINLVRHRAKAAGGCAASCRPCLVLAPVARASPTSPRAFFSSQDQDKVVMCPYSGEFFVRKGALEPLIKRGAIIERGALERSRRSGALGSRGPCSCPAHQDDPRR